MSSRSNHLIMKKNPLLVCMILLLAVAPFVYAGFFGDAWDTITGMATADNFSVQVTMTNDPPFITGVETVADLSIVAGDNTSLTFWFNATDPNGIPDLNNNSGRALINKSGTTYGPINCTDPQEDGNYSCTIPGIVFYSEPGVWTINLTVLDDSNNKSANNSFSFNILASLHINLTNANNLTFSSVQAGGTDFAGDNNITVYNIGNDYIVNMSISALDLTGVIDPAHHIYAENFSASTNATPCNNGASLVNDTGVDVVPNFELVRGAGSGVGTSNDTTYCLEVVQSGLLAQEYSTLALGKWVATGEV
ncbi:hypothetical protein GOV04_01795 [Candidatus Woesearchaeota archaeon]|nr:hypothetical protein [Candidatus Woesearchaeota archaeon]